MPYQKFWADLQKLTINSLASRLFASKSLTLSLAVAAAVSTQIGQQPAQASTVPTWQFDPATNELVINLPEGTTPKYSVLNSTQIAVDLPNTEIGIDATQLYPEGMVRSVGITQIQGAKARIVLGLAPGFAIVSDRTVFQKVGAANRWVLVPAIAPSSTQTAATPPRSTSEVPQDRSTTASPSTAVEPPVEDYRTNPSQQTTENDQIRPITVPLVRVAVQERRGGITVVPTVVPATPKQQIINFGEPLPK